MINVKLVGASGYTGCDIFRLLHCHPEVRITACSAIIEKRQPIYEFLPALRGQTDQQIVPVGDPEEVEAEGDVVFLAVPDNVAHKLAPGYLERGFRVIDLSADFRFKDAALHDSWYGFELSNTNLLREAVYGLSEIMPDEIAKARLLANPGCYPTSALLALAPLFMGNTSPVDTDSIIVDSQTGVSGGGRNAKFVFQFVLRNENLAAYGLPRHRHTPEIEMGLELISKGRLKPKVLFVPHLVPINRGILSTIYADLTAGVSEAELTERYVVFYRDCPFVRILADGSLPQVQAVQETNFIDIALRIDPRTNRVVLISALDNLTKGAAGQAVQNMNIMCGLPETMGLL